MMSLASQYLRFASALLVLGAACFAYAMSAKAQSRPAAPAPQEIRYCTNCATVESLNALRGATGAQRFEMVIRYTDGSTRTFKYDNDPGLRAGEKVKDNNGVVMRDGAGKTSP